MIQKIKLKNFRKFEAFELEINKKIVVLHGNNAKGKSTILEAICLLTNGFSPWASTDEFISNNKNNGDRFSRIELEIDDKEISFFKDSRKKEFRIDNKKIPAKKFLEQFASTIFNPEQIEILMISPSKRREFLDEAIVTLEYDFSNKLKVFRKVLKQRNSYLKKLSKAFYERGVIARNDPQLNFWSKELLDVSEYIQKKRSEICEDLSSKDLKIEYIKSNREFNLEKAIEESKKRDIATGYTNVGPHRDDWRLINGSDIKKFGSRGQKRLAISRLIFSKQDLFAERLGFYPILLLDDIASELDEENSNIVFDMDVLGKQQTFITIVDYKDLPKKIRDVAQLVDLNELK